MCLFFRGFETERDLLYLLGRNTIYLLCVLTVVHCTVAHEESIAIVLRSVAG